MGQTENLTGVQNDDLFQAYVNVEEETTRIHRQKRNVKVSLGFLKTNPLGYGMFLWVVVPVYSS